MSNGARTSFIAPYLSRLWRRKYIIGAGVVLVTALVWGAALLVPPVYTAQASLLIESGDVASERVVLRSRGLAQAVITDLRLMDDPHFNPALATAAPEKFKGPALHNAAQSDIPPGLMDRTQGAVIDVLLARVAVDADGQGAVLHLSYRDADPVRAALIANRFATLYAERRLSAQMEQQNSTTAWLAARLETLRAQMAEADNKLLHFRTTHDLPAAPPDDLPADDDRAVVLAEYRTHDAELRVKLASLAERYGDRHPKMMAVRAALAESEKRLRSITLRESPAAAAKPVPVPDDSVSAEQQKLAREAATARQMFDSFLRTWQDLQTPPLDLSSGARLISPAIIPSSPDYPPTRDWLMAAAGGSLALFSLMALCTGITQRTFRTGQDIEDHTGLSCYALLPALTSDPASVAPADLILSPTASQAAESVRSLRAMITLRTPAGGERPRVITLTSSYQGEGKSTLAAWLARSATQSKEKVIIIDCDLRRPALHKSFGIVRDKTLVDYLDGKATLEQVVNTSDPGGVHIICARSVPPRALDLLGSDKLHRLITALRKTYDLVILDAPACMAVTDPLLLARQSDLTLYNVIWNETPRAVLDTALRLFNPADRTRMALVLNKVDLSAYAAYGYGDVRYEYVAAATT
jgi:capsular exopolysaccharide synthesis family protein